MNEIEWSNCCVGDLCFQCGLTMPSDEQMAKDFQWADYFVALVLFVVGVWNMVAFYRVYRENNNYISIMRIGNTIYAFGTGIFGLARIHYQLGKPLLVFAAIHNLCEWIFVAYAFYKNKKQREYAIFGSTVWIFLVIGMILVVLSDFPYFALAEQITGISLDFMLPFVWFILWNQNRQNNDNNNNKKDDDKDLKSKLIVDRSSEAAVYNIADIYMIAFIGHIIHILFTILPLVVVNFIRDRNELLSRIIEFLIFLSVPLTHILYTRFVDLHEQYIDLPSYKNGDDDNGQENYADNLIVGRLPIVCCCIKNNKNLSAFIRVLSWYLLGIIIGLFPVVIIPAIIPQCQQEASSSGGVEGISQ